MAASRSEAGSAGSPAGKWSRAARETIPRRSGFLEPPPRPSPFLRELLGSGRAPATLPEQGRLGNRGPRLRLHATLPGYVSMPSPRAALIPQADRCSVKVRSTS
jgi:hypothetical protein